jgi:hypothetical protein
MSQPLLSILIPTVSGREDSFNQLYAELNKQAKDYSIEILCRKDNKEMTIGDKRTLLYHDAQGMYSVQWDDDDFIAPNGIQEIVRALNINKNVDCVVYRERCIINGHYYKSNHSIHYPDWDGDGNTILYDGFHYHRTPFFKDVIKTEIARSVPVPSSRFGEDHEWSKLVRPLLKTQTGILQEIYYYIHESSEFNERYGINRQ